MFSVGQMVSVSVTRVKQRGVFTRVTLSMDPNDLHTNYTAGQIQPGMVFTCAVQSVEDKGYVMDIGIQGAQTFMRKEAANVYIKQINRNKPLGKDKKIKKKSTVL